MSPTTWDERDTVIPFKWEDFDVTDTWTNFGTNRSWADVAATAWTERAAI